MGPEQQQQRRHHHRLAADAPGGAAPPETEPIPCPRCESVNTKFCYYNNYNLSQPRYFCKSCRRYWTQGGTLRNIPIGGGTRRNAKRSRTCTPTPTISQHNTSPITIIAAASTSTSVCSGLTINTSSSSSSSSCSSSKGGDSDHVLFNGSFTSLLNSQGGCGFWGLDEMGLLGQRRSAGVWPWMEFGGSLQIGGGATGVADGAFVDGVVDCFSWPELAISSAPTEGALN